MNLGKIVVLFLVSVVFLTFFNFYLAPLYYNFTNGTGQSLGETLLTHLMALGAAFLIALALMKQAKKGEAEGGDNS